jgi:S-methylmethionine-dependent homocysteine/selenocysteine methylase
MKRWQTKLLADQPVLLDGGTGSELKRRGVPHHPVAWSALAALTHPDTLRNIHLDFLTAGADVIIANTFAGARFVLAAAGRGDDFASANRRAVELALEAREIAGRPDAAVAGSLSNLPPDFDLNGYPGARTEAEDYLALAELLAESGVDLLALEMLQDLDHAPRLAAAAKSVGLPVWMGVSCRMDASGKLVGFDRADIDTVNVLDELLRFSPEVVNVMHTPLDATLAAVRGVRTRWFGPLGVYPETEESHGRLEDQVAAWRAAGVSLFGGCCGTTPEDIAAIRRALGG